jgi:predicted nuclease with TOPRIM domain
LPIILQFIPYLAVSDREHTAITQRLANLDVQKRRLYRLYASGEYDQKMLDDELDRLGTERSGLQERLKEIERAVQLRQEILDRKNQIEEYCERARENIDSFGFDEKRLALDALNVNVRVKGKDVALSGVIPTHFGIRTPYQDRVRTGKG